MMLFSKKDEGNTKESQPVSDEEQSETPSVDEQPEAAASSDEAEQAEETKSEAAAAEQPSELGSDDDRDDHDDHDDHDDDEGPVTEGEEDHLAPAYGLDDGQLMGEADHAEAQRSMAKATRIESVKEFFNTELLYRHDILDDEVRSVLAGNFRIELRGESDGVWTMKLGDELSVVNESGDADTVLSMQSRDFLQLVNGELNPQIAFLAQKIKVTGDLKKALVLQELLAPMAE